MSFGKTKLEQMVVGIEGAVEEVLQYMKDAAKRGVHFDGFLTFSQGGTVAIRINSAL
jgi:hypothetical protein